MNNKNTVTKDDIKTSSTGDNKIISLLIKLIIFALDKQNI